jgi:hypothetical protein
MMMKNQNNTNDDYEDKQILSTIFKKIKSFSSEELESKIKDSEIIFKKQQEELRKLLRLYSKTALIEMILEAWINKTDENFTRYKLRNRGKERQMENRQYYEKLAEEVYTEMLTKKQKLSLETLTFALARKYSDIRWQNNSDPELTEKKLKDVVKLKAIYSKLRKKYIR